MKNRSTFAIFFFSFTAMTLVAGPPSATKSEFFISKAAGVFWRKDGSGRPYISCSIPQTAPEVMYIIAEFPDLSKSGKTYMIKQTIHRKSGTMKVEGNRSSGWQNRKTYKYVIHVYSDPEFKNKLGIHKQKTFCSIPPKHILEQLKEQDVQQVSGDNATTSPDN